MSPRSRPRVLKLSPEALAQLESARVYVYTEGRVNYVISIPSEVHLEQVKKEHIQVEAEIRE